ncbi:MAG: ElyC/SanA/YdcF family protein [Bacteroidota bacterium]
MFIGILSLLGVIFLSDSFPRWTAKDRLYEEADNVPKHLVGLLLGTSKQLADGRTNLYYAYRLQAAAELYKAGKIEFILASGDNSVKTYDEPTDMKADLIAQGVPESKIFLDYAGFRTLDSVVRAKAIFGQTEFVAISQAFHNERAIFIAKWKGINAVGYNAKDIGGRVGLKIHLREALARVKMMLDLIFGKEPKFYGEPIEIE